MATRTFTAPKAFITINSKPAGYIRNISFTENINRADVQGLGNLTKQEVPATMYTCTFNTDFFFISFAEPDVQELINRLGGVEPFKNTLILGELPFSITFYSKTATTIDQNTRLVTQIDRSGQTIAVLRECFIDNQSFTLAEGGIASLTTSGRYLEPVTFRSE